MGMAETHVPRSGKRPTPTGKNSSPLPRDASRRWLPCPSYGAGASTTMKVFVEMQSTVRLLARGKVHHTP